jgi:hypothetical protein
MAYLESTGAALIDPLVELWNNFAVALPGLIAALIIILVGLIIGSAVGLLVKKILERSKLDLHLKKAGLTVGFINIASLIGALVKWYIFAIFLIPASDQLKFGVLSNLLQKFALWLPNLIAAIAVLVFGVIIADFIADRMLHAKRKGVRLLSSLVRWVLIIYIVLIAMEQVGMNVTLATNTALIIVAALATGLAIAFGIGFGFAFRDEAKLILKHIKKKW